MDPRVARWYIFKPKITVWVNFGGQWRWKMFVCFMAMWSIHVLPPFGTLMYFTAIGKFSGNFFGGYIATRKIWQP
jgi:hypothetical protein